MGLISEIYNLPDVNFIDDMELEDVIKRLNDPNDI